MVYVFDIDGTICNNTNGKYDQAFPFKERIEKINLLYEKGNTIIFLTARGMGRNNNNIKKSYEEYYDFTLTQLKLWGIKFHSLYLGKPSGDYYIDDKGMKDEEFFGNKICTEGMGI